MFAGVCAGQAGQAAPQAGAGAPAVPAATQSDGKTTTLSVTANLVNLPVIVRDKKGAPVTTLTKADFALTVDGHAEVIRYFDRDQNLPLTLGLLVDTSQSQRSVLGEERDASWEFLDKMLTTPAGSAAPAATAVSSGPAKAESKVADRAFIVQFAREVELLQDLTSSRPKLQAAIKEIGTSNPKLTSTDDDDRDNTGRPQHGGTALYDAVFLSADELMKKQQGRKALIVLSDGVDRNSKVSLTRAIEGAQRTDTIIYAIYFKGEDHRDQDNRNAGYPGGGGRGGGYPGGGYPGGGYPGGGYPGGGRGGRGGGQQPQQERGIDGKRVLQQMADDTGGRLFEVKGKQRIAEIYDQIVEELRSQYRLAYTPDAEISGDGYHKVELKIPAQKNLKVQTRDGYYTGK